MFNWRYAISMSNYLARAKRGGKVSAFRTASRRNFGPITGSRYLLKTVREYCLIVEGAYLSESEAEHALRDPFIEDWVEQTGRFRLHNMDEILITPGVTLGQLGIVMIDDRVFEIASTDADHPLTEHTAKGVAEALRRQDMFDEIRTEPREEA